MMSENTIIEENLGTVVQNSTIDNSNVANRDFYQFNETNPSFSSVQFDGKYYPLPSFTAAVLELIKTNRIIILKGNNHFDHMSFGKQMARKIIESQPDYSAIELIQNEENKPLIKQLNNRKQNQIVLLDGLHPKHIDYDLNKLVAICEQKSSYYIIYTETSYDNWQKAGDLMSHYWYEIPEQENYNHADLCSWFMNEIIEHPILFLTDEEVISPETLLSDSLSIDYVVSKISSPSKLIFFLTICRQKHKLFSDLKLIQTFDQLNQEPSQIVTRWFNNLSPNEKVIALTAALFNGLFVNQYFEILNVLMAKTVWEQQQQTLAGLDYHNLEFLNDFFRYETVEQGDMIVARNHTIRVNLLKTAIKQYPRHIESALLAFATIMEASYRKEISNWDLYGTTQKRALLRQVFTEAARDIGINQLSNIEGVFLKLAASGHKHIQGIAAKSMAQYRALGHDDLLFETIKKWQEDQRIKNRMSLFVKVQSLPEKKVISAIKSTTIRTLAYAADYDKPNKLHDSIVDGLLSFSKESDSEIQKAVADSLPKFIRHHSQQLQNRIYDDLMPVSNYATAISKGLSKAYAHYPDRLKSVIEHWLSICLQSNSEENRQHKTTYRDNRLVAIIKTLQSFDLSDDKGFSLQELYAFSIQLLQIEKRSTVIDVLTEFIATIQTKDYSLAYVNIPETLQSFSKRQRKIVVKVWAEAYLKERNELANGEFSIIIRDKTYPAWDKMIKRPLLTIEKELFDWLNSNSKTAQKYATLAFLEFVRVFEAEEYEEIQVHKTKMAEMEAQRIKQKQVSNVIAASQNAIEMGLGFWLRLKIFFYLLFEKKTTKQSLKRVIKIFLAGSYTKHHLRLVTYKWRKRSKGDFSSKLAKWLDKLIHQIKS